VSDALNFRSGHRLPFNILRFSTKMPGSSPGKKSLTMSQRKVMSEKPHLTSF